MEIQLIFTIIILFVSGFDIAEDILSNIKPTKTSYVFWHEHCWHFEINDLILAAINLYKYIWKVILCIVLIGNRCFGPNIWPKIPGQAKSIKNIMRIIWVEEEYC